MYYNYFSWDYSKYIDTDTVWTDNVNCPIELRILLEYLNVAE